MILNHSQHWRHVPERLCGGYVYLRRYIKCSTYTYTFHLTSRYLMIWGRRVVLTPNTEDLVSPIRIPITVRSKHLSGVSMFQEVQRDTYFLR